MRLGDRVDDGQAKPDPTVSPGACRVSSREAIEDVRKRVRVDAAALVLDLDHDRRAVGSRPELDRIRALGVVDGVLEQSVEGDPERLRIRPH